MRKQNHFRRFAAALLTIIMISTLCSPALAARDDADKGIDLKIAVMSDTHYLSPHMIKDTSDYTDALNSDRKLHEKRKYAQHLGYSALHRAVAYRRKHHRKHGIQRSDNGGCHYISCGFIHCCLH